MQVSISNLLIAGFFAFIWVESVFDCADPWSNCIAQQPVHHRTFHGQKTIPKNPLSDLFTMLFRFNLVVYVLSMVVPGHLFQPLHSILSESLCALFCASQPSCSSFQYKDSKVERNCVLRTQFEDHQGNNEISIPDGFDHQFLHVSSKPKKVFFRPISNGNVEENANKAGFNHSIVINGTKIYLARISLPTLFNDAIGQCFLNGGILPMENTDDFIDAMSDLTNDSITARFTSLAREFTGKNGIRHLTWNLGLKEWGEDENWSSTPKYQNWPRANYESYLFQIDPMTKHFIPSTIDNFNNLHYCQYLGENLATGKSVTSSSTRGNLIAEKAVDGTLGESYWHAEQDLHYQPDWISIDLGISFAVKTVLWMGRPNYGIARNKNIQVWIGSNFLANNTMWKDSNFHAMNYCGMHPYATPLTILSGVTCKCLMIGRYVTIVNNDWQDSEKPMQIGEVAIFTRNG